jgi:hypothetical protein
VTADVAACPTCGAASTGGSYCRQCGAPLRAGAVPVQPPPQAAAPAGSPQPAPIYQQQLPTLSPWPVSHWIPVQGQVPSPPRRSNAFAVGGMVAIVLFLLAIAATIILLVAGTGSNHTGILTQATTTAGKSEQTASP